MQVTSRRRTALTLGILAVAGGLGACQAARHEATTRANYTLEADRIFSEELFDSNGPSLVAGDGLAMRMLVAGAYTPRDELQNRTIETRFVDVPATTD